MSTRNIEEQVVKMQFDNKGFESGVQQSMSTLDKLKAALHFKDVNLTPLERAFQQTEATATQAGFHIRDVWLKISEVFEYEIARKIMNAGENLVKSLSVDNISDGWSKYEQKTGNVQTLLNSTGKSIDEVNGYLEQLMWYSDETSFGFTDMTSALSTMVSSGGDIEKLIPMIEGMGNATAYAGKGAAEFSRVIYNLNQSYSQGFLSTMDWRSVEMAGASSKQLKQYLMEAAEEVGTIKKGTSDIASWSEYLTKKKITSEAMEIAFKRFAEYTEAVKEAVNSGQYETATEAMEAMATDGFDEIAVSAFNAAQNYKSFSEAVDATKDAVSSGWLSTFELIFGNFEEAKKLWTSIGNGFWEIFASGSEHRNDIIGELMNDPLDTFVDKLQHCGISMEQFESTFRSVAKKNGIAIDSLIERYGGFNEFIRSGNITSKSLIKETLSALTDTQKTNIKATNDALSSLEKYQEAINKVMTDPALGTGAERIKKLTEAGYDAAGTQKLINHLYEKNGKTYKDMTVSTSDFIEVLGELNETELESIGLNEEQMAKLKELAETADQTGESFGDLLARMYKPSGRELFFESLSNAMDILIDTINIVKSSFRNIFPEVAVQSWYDAIEAVTIGTREVKAFLENEENADKLSKSLGGLFSILKLIAMTTKGAITVAFKILKAVLKEFDMDILSLTANIGDSITTFVKWIEQQELAKNIAKGISEAIKGIISVIKNAATAISKSFSKIKNDLKDFWNEFVNLPIIQEMISDFTNVLDSIGESFGNIKFSLTDADGEASKFFSKIKNKASLDKLNTVLTKVYNKLKDFKNVLVNVKNSFVNFFKELKNGKSISESFKDSFGGIVETFNKIKTAITEFFNKMFGGEGSTKEKFENLSKTIHDFFTSLDADKITAIALTTVFGLFAINLLRLTNAVSDTVAAIGGTFNTLKTVINSYMKRQKNVILQIAEAIVIVAAALYVLSTIKPENMQRALTSLYAISGCIAVLMIVATAASKISNAGLPEKAKITRMSESVGAMIGLAGVVVLAAVGIKKIAELKLGEGIIKKVGLTIGVVTALAGLSVLMSKFRVSEGSAIKSATTILSIAGSLYLIALAMEKISQTAKDADTLKATTDAMIKMMAGLAIISLAAGSIGGFSALGLLAIVVLFEKLMPRIEGIITYDYTAINAGLDKNKEVIEKIGSMVGAMIIIGGLFGKGFSNMGTGLIKLVVVIGLLAVIAEKAGKLTTAGITKGTKFISSLTTMLTELVIAMGIYNLMSKLDKGQKGGLGLGAFIGIIATLGVMTLIAKAAGNMDDSSIKKGLKFVGALTLLIDAMFVAAGLSSRGSGVSFKSLALVLAGISFILGLLVTLSLIKDTKSLYTAVAAVAVVISSLSVLFSAISKINSESTKIADFTNKSGSNSGVIFAALAGVAAIIGGMIWLSKQPFENVAASAAALVVTMYAYTKVFAAVQKNYGVAGATNKKRVVTILSALASVAAITAAIVWLSNKGGDAKNMASAAAGITVGLLGLSTCLKTLSKISGTTKDMNYKKLWHTIGGGIVILAAVAGAIGLLSHFGGSAEGMISSATAITIGCIGVAICMTAIAYASSIIAQNGGKISSGVIIGAIASMVLIAGAIWALSNYGGDTQKMMSSAIAIGIGSIAIGVTAVLLAAASKLCGTSNPISAGTIIIGAIAAMIAVAAAMYVLGEKMSDEGVNRIIALAPSFALLMAAFGVMAIALSAATLILGGGALAAGALAVIGVTVVALIAIVAIVMGLGAILEECTNGKKYLESGLEALVDISGSIGKAIGELIGNFITAINDSVLLHLGETLNKAMDEDHLGGFFKKVQTVPERAVKGAANIAAVLAAWTSVAWADTIANFFGVDFASIDMSAVGDIVVAFTKSVSSLTENDVKKAEMASTVAVKLSEFADKMPRSGWWEAIVGEKKDVGEFGKEMTKLATGIKDTATAAGQITDTDIDNISRMIVAAEVVNDFSKTLENTGGLLAKIVGDNDLETFGDTLVPFIEELTEFVDASRELEKGGDYAQIITNVIDAVEPLNNFAKSIELTGGLLAGIVGDDSLKSFGKTLVPFVTNLADFIDISKERISSKSADYINRVKDATIPLIDLSDYLSGNKHNFLGIGETDLGEFGSSIKKFAKKISEVCDDYDDIDIDVIEDIRDAATIAKDISTICETIVPKNIENLAKSFDELADVNIKKVVKAFNTDITIETAVDSMITKVIELVERRQEDLSFKFVTVTKDAINSMKKAFDDGCNSTILPSVSSLINNIKNELSLNFVASDFAVYGSNVSIGLANGINGSAHYAISASTALGKSVADSLAKALDEHSPSKISNRMGAFWDKGLANGIKENTGEVVNSTDALADEVIKSTNNIISEIVSIMDSDMDLQPTIRPVVDMSDVEDKSKNINKILNGNAKINSPTAFNKSDLFLVRTASDSFKTSANGSVENIDGSAHNSYNFTQNNYSPKALSRIDIYRQTNNQISMLRSSMA